MLLATDLDGTFLGGSHSDRHDLYNVIKESDHIRLVFVTGRGVESVIPLLNDSFIPKPAFIIADVGATIVNGHTLESIEPLQKEIEDKWPGQTKIFEAVKNIKGLEFQTVPQQRRCSFLLSDTSVLPEINEIADSLGCDVIYSAGRFLDFVSKGVNKGATLLNLTKLLSYTSDQVLVAGDTMNDLSLYKHGFKGVVVGNAEADLVRSTRSIKDIFYAGANGAGGIQQSLQHFKFAKKKVSPDFSISNSGISEELIMMYHRFPYEMKEVNGEMVRTPQVSPNGIIPTLKSFFSSGRRGLWIAWEEVSDNENILENIHIDSEKYPNLIASRVGLTQEEISVYYKVFAKEAFWPVIFGFADKAHFNHEHWKHFVDINQRFADKAASEAKPNAWVWIHDYNLWLVPGMLKEQRPDLKIAFFHHTAFPAANTFNILPWRREIIGSLLQCDFIGFHIPRYVENFVDVVRSLFPIKKLVRESCAPRFLTFSSAIGVSEMAHSLVVGENSVKLGAIPVGIDTRQINRIMQKKSVFDKIIATKKMLAGKKMILSAERLDYVKGPLEKMLAFEQLLEHHPEFHGKVELVNICTPPAEGMKIYDSIKLEIESAVGRINGRFSKMDWTPVRVFFRSVPFEEILVYYGAADVAWITPLRDGLNLVAKEYVAVQHVAAIEKGVLILSEFAGAAVELPYALLTNPYDQHSLEEVLVQALTMRADERKMRMERLYQQVKYFNVEYWADQFLSQAFLEQDEYFVNPGVFAAVNN
ncbi:glucosylglycerol-phosphate synthase [Pollutibacter soli]|uniref:glucosylglycerol-phosphate synthase n=1 Tax=Pollutibacter soli TaxID=3034157 RepID=UPI0030133AAD